MLRIQQFSRHPKDKCITHPFRKRFPSRGEKHKILGKLPMSRILDTMVVPQVGSQTMELAPATPAAQSCRSNDLAVEPQMKPVSIRDMGNQVAEAENKKRVKTKTAIAYRNSPTE